MGKKKICMMFNHFQLQDGVCRSAIAIANLLAERDDCEITLIPLFEYDNEALKYVSVGVRVKPVFRTYFKGMSGFIKLIPNNLLYKLIVGDKYDVNIAFQYGTSQLIMAVGVSNQHKTISWVHTYDKGLVFKDCYKKIGNVVHVAKCNVQLFKDEIQDESINVDYNYNPIDDDFVRKQGETSIPIKKNSNVQFVSVGRMSEEKGYIMLLRSVERLKKEGYSFSLWLVGDGPQLQGLKDFATQAEINGYVVFLGRQNNPHAYTAKSDVFVCSSTSEGYSTACTEAIMLNVPVISTNVSGADEIIEEAGCGLVFDSTENAIYYNMKKVLDNPSLVKEWKETLKSTKFNFSPEKRFERFKKIVGI